MDELYHYGTPRHSGRYPWGSGKDPYQKNKTWYGEYKKLKASGMSQTDIVKAMGLSSTGELRAKITQASNQEKAYNTQKIVRLRYEKQMSEKAIADLLGMTEGNVRYYLKNADRMKVNKTTTIADTLEAEMKKHRYIDIGSGCEQDLNCSKQSLKAALDLMKERGYEVVEVNIPQAYNPSQFTNVLALCPPGTTKGELWANRDDIGTINTYIPEGSNTFQQLYFPTSVDSKRIMVRYAEEGGLDKDGVIEIRKGVDDLTLGNAMYAQVRIAVDGTHYLKGMAVYSDGADWPPGVDIVVDSNKKSGTPLTSTDPKASTVAKAMKTNKDGTINEDNPFGAAIKMEKLNDDGTIKAGGQTFYEDAKGKFIKQGNVFVPDENGTKGPHYSLSPINKLKEEGDWEHYKKTLSSQFLSKQSEELIKKQLDLNYAKKKKEYDDILALDNEVVKQKLLEEFAMKCDSSSAHLDAAALPRQASKVILPVPSLADNEVYAPSFNDGEKVVLIRFPHAGTFEIPELYVNNKNKDAISMIPKDSIDAIGINKKNADKLSGADFDGDSVVVIPVNDKVKIKSSPTLKGLKDFDDKAEYPYVEGMKVLTKQRHGMEMGSVSNLITDMQLKGAPESEITRAVKHSMVVVDAEKHKLNYKLSEEVNGIKALKTKYQGGPNAGASTLISKAEADARYEEEKKSYKPNEKGEWEYTKTGNTYKKNVVKTRTVTDSDGNKVKKNFNITTDGELVERKTRKVTDAKGNIKNEVYYLKQDGSEIKEKVKLQTQDVVRLSKSSKMSRYDDAYQLSSGTKKEAIYADYANSLKQLAKDARKEQYSITPPKKNSSAAQAYAEEVKSLNDKLKIAERNAPKERQAQIKTSVYYQSIKNDPDLSKDDKEKYTQQALAKNRALYGANKKSVQIQITDREWEAIQAKAVSPTTLRKILNNTDMDKVRQKATPRDTNNKLSPSTINYIKSLQRSGHTVKEIADATNLSTSSIAKYL